ncbi:hypothetical protein KBZ10_04790 [Streptomyces sp. F63]|uniref:hypothetical protein n=1 Tax=Streptomyces sp. F63 TaxID=2824887 RepID=UPI001B369B75|nr:hypothetical protein [Streptomyces sp. F63]MBQ0983850.1 hypothetical protein [Streptomyces sp. F63]
MTKAGTTSTQGRTKSPATPLDRALIEEAAKKSGLVWVRGSADPDRPLWHVWHEGAVCVVGGGPGEQPLTGLDRADGSGARTTVTVTVRSKDKGGRLVSFQAAVTELPPGSPEWAATVAELSGKRLNAPDSGSVTERWARECRVLRLTPAGGPAPLPDGSLAAPPPVTPATTRRAAPGALPKLLLRGRGRR